MKRYSFIFIFVLIAFSGLTIYWVKAKPKPKPIPLKSKKCESNISADRECINGKLAAAHSVRVKFDKSITDEQVANLLKNLDVGKYSKAIGVNDYDISSEHTITSTLIEQFSKLNGVISIEPWYISYIE